MSKLKEKINKQLIPRLNSRSCRKLQVTKQIGTPSVNGVVFATTDDRYVLKYIKVGSIHSIKDFMNEVYVGTLMKRAQRRGMDFAVRVICHSNENDTLKLGGGILIMDNVQKRGEIAMDLMKYLQDGKVKRFEVGYMRELQKAIVRYWTAVSGYYILHGDLHAENIFIIFDKKYKFKKFRILDLGSSLIIKRKDSKKHKTFLDLWLDIVKHIHTKNSKADIVTFNPVKTRGGKLKVTKQLKRVPVRAGGQHFGLNLKLFNDGVPRLLNLDWIKKYVNPIKLDFDYKMKL